MRIPKGYKKTAVGIIPDDWEVKKLQNLNLSVKSGRNKVKKKSGKYKVFGSTGVIGYCEESVYDEPLVLCARVGANAGFIYSINEPCDVSDNTLIISGFERVSRKFCEESLKEYNLNRLIFGSGQPLITGKLLKNIKLPIPPLPEQKAISKVLSTWDNAIEKYEALLKQYELRKKWLMQNLLTGKKNWKTFKLKELCKITKGKQLNRINLTETGKYPSYSGGISPSGYTDKWNTNENTIIISEGGNSCGYINFVTTKFWSGGHCYALLELSSSIKRDFFFQILKFNQPEIMRLRVGSGLPNIQKKDIENYKLNIPPIEEQTAIANILQTADKEIKLTEERIEKLREQKKGLMQQLLTGKVRLVSSEK